MAKMSVHVPYIVLLGLVVVVAVVVVLLSSDQTPEEIVIYDEDGNVAGAARWTGLGYKSTSQVVQSGGDNCKPCTSDCQVCGANPDCGLCKKGSKWEKSASLR